MRTAAACCSSSDFRVYGGEGDGASPPRPFTAESDFHGADVAPQLPMNPGSKSAKHVFTVCVVFRVKRKRQFFRFRTDWPMVA